MLRLNTSTHAPEWVDDGPCPDDCTRHGLLVGTEVERHRRLDWVEAHCFSGWLPRADGDPLDRLRHTETP